MLFLFLFSSVCCEDKKSCCPSGTTCNVAAMKCEKDGLAMPMGSKMHLLMPEA